MDLLYWTIFIVAYRVVVGISDKLEVKEDAAAISVAADASDAYKTHEDIEVKHTIVVSTILKNNGAVNSSNSGEDSRIKLRQNKIKTPSDDSGEVPVVNGYLALESTQIKTPHTSKSYSDHRPTDYFVSYNINPDVFGVYPEFSADPKHWKPSTFYNNINYRTPGKETVVSRKLPGYRKRQRPGQVQDLEEYYCCKCKEYKDREARSTPISGPYPWYYETTTKVKIDGKIGTLD